MDEMVEQTPYQIALKKIEKANQTKSSHLSLRDIGLTTLPTEIGKLTHLTSLQLNNNQLIALPPEIGKLINLTVLHLNNNKLTTLPAEIGKLVNLTSLDLSSNQLTILPFEVGKLTKLIYLDLASNRLTTLPIEIRYITHLEWLNLSNRDFSGNTQPGENKIEELPVEILALTSLKRLDLRDSHLDIPPEILDKIYEPHVILNYLAGMLRGKKKPLNETKMLVLGQGSVGKTSLITRLIRDRYDPGQTKTEGIGIEYWQVINNSKDAHESPQINLNIWDFGGQEIMHATHQFFLTRRSLYLLVLDARLTQEENRVEYWLKIIQSFGGDSPILVVGNKTEQHPLDLNRTGLKEKYPNIVGILEISAATGDGFKELEVAIVNQVNALPHVRNMLPEAWFILKTALEELGREKNFITHDQYIELCAQNEISDELSQRTLISFLHDLGVVLHFQDDPRLESLGILNPQWVTNGVYKIINSHILFQNNGVLTVSMLDEILNLPEYPRGKRLFIVDMMKKFELCYDIEPDKTFLVPDLLPKDEPSELKLNGVPAFEYAYPVLPSSVITRFIVRMNQKIENHFVWRTGVVLKIGGNTALIKADIEDRKITIAIDGLEHTRRDALSAIRFQLDEIHASIKGLDAQKRVPIPNAPNAEPLEYDYLLMLEREGDETCRVKDGSRLVTVNVRQILSGIESETQRKETTSRVINIYGDVKDSNILAGDENELNTKG